VTPFQTSSISISEAIRFLNELLDPGAFEDHGPNGLQVPGGDTLSKVGASSPTGLTPTLAERVRPLFKHDVALAGYHLPLDAHPEVGNNALLAGLLGCERHGAREAGIHFIAAGHYATETFGVRRLGDLLAEHYDIVDEFVDIPNPV
jgi:putative NIF3 family GTP cyclohydrolase 1 type 2